VRPALFFCVAASALGCDKTPPHEGPGVTGSVSDSQAATPSAPRASHATATTAPIASWQGSYESAAGALTLPKGVQWRVPETASGLGAGKLELTVDPANGRVRGTVDGPIGPATLDGLLVGGRLTATIARRDPSDHGFIGTLAGQEGDGGVEGTMNVALAEASAIREATFRLSPAHGAQTPL
jgi:hypothetical protein